VLAVGDHVYALDCSDRIDVLQSFEGLDRWADDDVRVRPGAVLGLVAVPIPLVTRVRPHPGHSAMTDRRILGFAHDLARFRGVVHARNLYAHDALIEHERNVMYERFMDAHDSRHVRSGD